MCWKGRNLGGDAAARAGVKALDLTQPTPREIGTYNGMDVPERMLAAGGVLYLMGEDKTPPADMRVEGVPFSAGLRYQFRRCVTLHVIDAADPRNMTRIGTLAMPFRETFYGDCVCRAMALDRQVLLVADQDYGIRSVNVGDSRRPALLGGVRLVSHEVRGLLPAGQRLYAVNDSCINGVDMADPTQPRLDREGSLAEVSHWGLSCPVMAPGGRYLHSVSANGFELAISELGESLRPRLVGFVEPPAGWKFRELGYARGRLYVLASRADRAAATALCVYEPQDGGRVLKFKGTYPIAEFGSIVDQVWGTRMLVSGERIFILHATRGESPGSGKIAPGKSLDLVTIDVRPSGVPVVHRPADLLRLAPGLRPSYYSGQAMEYTDGWLVLYVEDESTPSAWLLVYDVSEPSTPRLIGRLKDPMPTTSVFNILNVTAMPPEPMVACTSEATGAWIVDVSDPRHPRTAWREPPANRGTDLFGYDSFAKAAAAWQDGLLFVPRLDRVDVLRVRTGDGPELSEARLAADIRAQIAFWKSTPSSRPAARDVLAAWRVAARVAEYELDRHDVQAAREFVSHANRLDAAVGGRSSDIVAHAAHARQAVTIDGRADDWAGVPEARFERGPANVRWQWDDKDLYMLFTVRDPDVERGPASGMMPCPVQDHVDVFLTALPVAKERYDGPADVRVSVDLTGRVLVSCHNPRFRGSANVFDMHEAQGARAAVSTTADGYMLELALPHGMTWVPAMAGARIACSAVVVDHGVEQMELRHTRPLGYVSAQPGWPTVELAP